MIDMSNTDWGIQLTKLVTHCTDQGLSVSFGRGSSDEYSKDDSSIKVNGRRTKQNQAYILLHEIGHHNIIAHENLSKKFACLNETNVPRNLSHKVLALEEEVFAWHMGEELAKTLDIPLGKSYQILKARCLKSYASLIV